MTDEDSKFEMWDYWRDKKDYVRALEDYYPEISATNIGLQIALQQIRSAHLTIDYVMEELKKAEEDND